MERKKSTITICEYLLQRGTFYALSRVVKLTLLAGSFSLIVK